MTASQASSHRLIKAVLAGIAVPVTAVAGASLAGGSLASAVWSAAGSGPATAAAYSMPTGTQPTASASNGSVSLSWDGVSLGGGPAVGGYEVTRSNPATGVSTSAGNGCSGVVTTTSCTEASVPPGEWEYTITPVQLSWTGTPGAPSAVIIIRGGIVGGGGGGS